MTTPRQHIEYPEKTMYRMIYDMAEQHPEAPAFDFYGRKISYRSFAARIDRAARAFRQAGIGMGDRVTICLPNVPQAMECFYALNRVGAVANMVHPLSARDEIAYYLNFSRSKMILTADMFCEKVEEALEQVDHPVTILVARMQDELPFPLNIGYVIKSGRPYLKYPNTDHAMLWEKFLKSADGKAAGEPLPEIEFDRTRTSVILYSGGTSGKPKGICISDFNMNALAMQGREVIGVTWMSGLSMLSCMPCFHGFGLGINLHLVLVLGGCCILMPSFNIKSYAEMLIKKKPCYIAGVPTIFEALLHLPEMDGADLSFLKGMFCGGDSLSIELKKKVDTFLKDHKATIQVREGYGLTECVTASCLTPKDTYKPGSIGVAFPDMTYAIVTPGTDEVVPYGQEGEIILTGPTLMLGYLDDPQATADTLRVLADGRTWLYTGDLGTMDEEHYVYFRQRIKRMIITNGYNVYPGPLENAIDSCPEVAYSCVIGVKDERRGRRIRAYVVLRDGFTGSEEIREKIMAALKTRIAGYALPKEIIFREELPKTLVGKVAYRKLEEEAEAELEAQKE